MLLFLPNVVETILGNLCNFRFR